MAAPDLELAADHLSWSPAGYEARGAPVTATWGDVRLTALRLARVGEELRAETGTVERHGATLSFGTATFVGGEARLTAVGYLPAATCVAPDADTLPLTAAALTVPADGPWILEGATLRPCACVAGRSLLSFSAREAEVVPEERATLHGGWVEVLGARVLPVPWWRVALDPAAFRLLFPEIGYGEPGWSVALAGAGGIRGGPLDGWRLRGGPAWREDRGARVELEARGAPGGLAGELAWDTVEGHARGALVGEGGVGTAGETLAWDLDLASDSAYADDYGPSWVARGVGWRDSRLRAVVGPNLLSGQLADDGSDVRVVGFGQEARVERARWGLGGATDLGLVGAATLGGAPGADDPGLDDADVRLAISGDTHAARTWGLVHAEGRAAALGYTYGAGGYGGWARGDARVELPVWTETTGGQRAQWWPGLLVEARHQDGDARVGEDRVARPVSEWTEGFAPVEPTGGGTALWAGPALRGAALVQGVDAAGEVRVGADLEGFAPSVRLSLADARRGLRLHADRDSQGGEARVRLGGERVTVTPRLGAWHDDDTFGAWGGVDGRYARLAWGAGAAMDVGEGALMGADARIAYDDGCAQVGVRAGFSPDRALPDLALLLSLRR